MNNNSETEEKLLHFSVSLIAFEALNPTAYIKLWKLTR